MKSVRCSNNHYYDSERFSECPVCNQSGEYQYHQQVLSGFKAYDGDEPYLFLSYSHSDSPQVEYYLELMRQNHFRFWFDEGIKSGREWSDVIADRIKNSSQFIVFISKDSMESDNVKDEIHLAVKYGVEIIRIHLDKTELHGGVELKLDRKQALYQYKYEQSDFEKRFCSALSLKAISRTSDVSEDAKIRLQERYEIKECIAVGGTSKAYIAYNKNTGSKVIVKSASIDDSLIGNNLKTFFNVEKEILAKRLTVFAPEMIDCYSDKNSIFLVESFIEGESLDKIKNLTIERLIGIMIKTAKIVSVFHKNGIAHCDIKPKHIICNDDECFLIDFGSSRIMGSDSQPYSMGTPGFSAPEQYSGYNGERDIYGDNTVLIGGFDNVDERTDIFSFGRTMRKMIQSVLTRVNDETCDTLTAPLLTAETTNPLFDNSTQALLTISDKLEKGPDIPDPLLRAIVDKMTMERKSDRFESMDEVIRVLKDYYRLNFGEEATNCDRQKA